MRKENKTEKEGVEAFLIGMDTSSINVEEYDECSEEAVEDSKLCCWRKDRNMFIPSGEITVVDKLSPGLYSIKYSRELGAFARKESFESDQLYHFSNEIIDNLYKEINSFWDKADLYEANKLIHKRGVLLEGYPGTGKSSIITQIYNNIVKSGGIVFKINNIDELLDYIQFIKQEFRNIQPDTPLITVIEDIDAYSNYESTILSFLDGQHQINHHIVICTTNDSSKLPDTMLRPSRLDLIVEVELPDEITRKEYLTFKNVPEADLELLVQKTDKLSLADLKELYISIYLLNYSVDDAIEKINNPLKKKNYKSSIKNSKPVGLI